jgi:HTH-type transcriptional regulator/antitoxin HipB
MAGHVVRKARKARGWSQDQLAKRMNVRQATISKLETGSPNTRMEVFFDALTALELELTAGPRVTESEIDFGDLY